MSRLGLVDVIERQQYAARQRWARNALRVEWVATAPPGPAAPPVATERSEGGRRGAGREPRSAAAAARPDAGHGGGRQQPAREGGRAA